MHRRTLLATAALASATGCSSLIGGDPDPGRLDLTVQNTRDRAVEVQVIVFDEDDTVYRLKGARIESGVAQSFDSEVGRSGRHEVLVRNDEFQSSLQWDAGVCTRYDARVLLTPDSVETSGECAESR